MRLIELMEHRRPAILVVKLMYKFKDPSAAISQSIYGLETSMQGVCHQVNSRDEVPHIPAEADESYNPEYDGSQRCACHAATSPDHMYGGSAKSAGIGGIKIMHAVETKSREESCLVSLYFPCRCLCLGFFELRGN